VSDRRTFVASQVAFGIHHERSREDPGPDRLNPGVSLPFLLRVAPFGHFASKNDLEDTQLRYSGAMVRRALESASAGLVPKTGRRHGGEGSGPAQKKAPAEAGPGHESWERLT
jgi:hypothetical protein